MRALIIQTNTDLGTLWKRHLERLDVAVSLAQTGEDARDLILSTRFDVIVLDLVLIVVESFMFLHMHFLRHFYLWELELL